MKCRIILAACSIAWSSVLAFADAAPSNMQWRTTQTKNGSKAFEAVLATGWSEKQVAILGSGLSAYSQYQVEAIGGSILARRNCAVEYNLWDRQYKATVLHHNHPHEVVVASDLAKLAAICMSALIPASAQNGALTEVKVTLTIGQVSPKQAQEIKNRLIKEQSFILKDLFSHMLGDPGSAESVTFRVPVP